MISEGAEEDKVQEADQSSDDESLSKVSTAYFVVFFSSSMEGVSSFTYNFGRDLGSAHTVSI